MIKAIFFDLDGTLFNRDATVADVLAWQIRTFCDVIPPTRAAEFCSRITTLDDHGHHDKREIYATVGADFELAPSIVEQLIATFWAEYPRHCHADDDVISTLVALRERGMSLGIVTNGATVVQEAAIDAIGVRTFMDAILVSEAEGISKPSPDIFHRAATRVAVPPRECCFVGDHPTVDVTGARTAGFFGVWKRTPYWPPVSGVPTIDRISEILAFVS